MKKVIFKFMIFFFFTGNLAVMSQTWEEQTTTTIQTLTSVSANSIYQVWVCGYGGVVFRSTNTGTSWQSVGSNGINPANQLINIAAISENVALTAGYIGPNTFVYRTSDGGASWTQVFTQTNGFINAVCFQSGTNTGFMVGDPVGGRWSLWKTTNGGINWDSSGLYLPQAGSEAGWNNSLYCKGDRLWFGTNNSRIYYSADFGSSWIIQPTTGEVNSYSVWIDKFSSDGLAGGANMLKTTNNGTNWNSQTSAGTGNFGGIAGGYIITESNFFAYTYYVRGTNQIFATSNNGASWYPQYTTSSGNYRHIAISQYGMGCWAVKDNGGITFNILFSGITQTGTGTPDKFFLFQNYPNPFNPKTIITYSIPYVQFVKVKVFDVAGNEIETLVSQKQNPGTYAVDWPSGKGMDPSNISSGIYFYNLTTDKFSETKKMILIK